MAVFNRVFLAVACVASLGGGAACFFSTRHIWCSFGVRRNIFLFLFLDSALSCVACVAQSVVYFCLLLVPVPNRALCCMLLVSPLIACYFGYAFMAVISWIRFRAVTSPHTTTGSGGGPAKWRPGHKRRHPTEDGGVPTGAYVFIAGLAAASAAYVPPIFLYDIPLGVSSEICLHGPGPRRPPAALYFYLPLPFVVSLTAFAVSLDLRLLCLLRSQVARSQLTSRYLRVPMRATAFSALSLIPLIFVASGRAIGDPLVAAYTMMGVGVVLTAGRAPTAVAMTFQRFEALQEASRRNERDRRLQFELKNAYRGRLSRSEEVTTTISACYENRVKLKFDDNFMKQLEEVSDASMARQTTDLV